MNSLLKTDVAIIGGGIGGLWVLSRLRALGYGAVLIEGSRLGAGQTLLSQGLIHSGAGYTPAELDSAAGPADSLSQHWRRCLAGIGEVDLSGVRQLSAQQYLWVIPPAGKRRLFGWFRKKLQIPPAANALDSAEYPAVLRAARLRGDVYRLEEPVLDCASLLQALAERHREAILLNQGPAVLTSDGAITVRAPAQASLVIQPQVTVFTAGIGNTFLVWAPLQVQPLHMVMIRSRDLPADVYIHCLSEELAVPRLTITSHQDRNGRTVWYLGGHLAQEGARRRSKEQIRQTRRELARLLPGLDLSGAEFATLHTQRITRKRSGDNGNAPSVYQTGKIIAAWPNRLALAPRLADEVAVVLKRNGVQPSRLDLGPLLDWPRPEVAAHPWDDEKVVWSR